MWLSLSEEDRWLDSDMHADNLIPHLKTARMSYGKKKKNKTKNKKEMLKARSKHIAPKSVICTILAKWAINILTHQWYFVTEDHVLD